MAIAMADTHLDLSMTDSHPDLAPNREGTDTGGKKSSLFISLFMFFSIFLGVLFVVLCIKAESTRPQLIREVSDGDQVHPEIPDDYEELYSDCVYTSNRKKPLICGVGAFLCLAIVMVVQHKYLVFYVSKTYPKHSLLMTLDPRGHHDLSKYTRKERIFGLIYIWTCFAVAEIMLLIGISVEVRHLKGWLSPGTTCYDGPMSLFYMAALFGVSSALVATLVSIEVLDTQWLLLLDQEKVPQEVELT